MKKLTEHLSDDATRDLYVNEGNVESVVPLDQGRSSLRMLGGTMFVVRGDAEEVAATLKTASAEAIETIRDNLIPALASIAPAIGTVAAGGEAAPVS